jgi:iron-sulfur cluster repair protein YtfE (RIC family)
MADKQALIIDFINVHTAMRCDLEAFEARVSRATGLNNDDLIKMAKRFEFFWEMVESHHLGEDHYFYPAIGQYDPNFLKEMAGLTDEHHQIDAQVEKIRETLERLPRTRDGQERESGLSQFAGQIKTLQETLLEHLTREEAIIFPSIEQHIPPKQQAVIGKNYRKQHTIKNFPLLAAWVVENQPPKQQLTFIAESPFLVRAIYYFSWRTKYVSLMANYQF